MATSSPVPPPESFTGKVLIGFGDPVRIFLRVDGNANDIPMTCDTGCDDDGFDSALRKLKGQVGNTITVQGFTGQCGVETVLHVTSN